MALNPLSDSAQLTVTITGANDAPVVTHAMADQHAQAGNVFSFALPAAAFTDVDHGDHLALQRDARRRFGAAGLARVQPGNRDVQWDCARGSRRQHAPDRRSPRPTSRARRPRTFSPLRSTSAPAADPSHGTAGRHIVGTRRKDQLVGTPGDDFIEGRNGNDRLRGKGGVDILQGGKGNDELVDRSGNTVFDGGRGNDRLTGGRDDDFFAGGRGNDRLQLGGGADVVAFNKGDGVDRLFGERQDGVLSLGGGIRYEDLRLRKQGHDLVLRTGGGDQVVLEDWYRGKQSIVTLQVVAEAMSCFSQGSHDPFRDDKVETLRLPQAGGRLRRRARRPSPHAELEHDERAPRRASRRQRLRRARRRSRLPLRDDRYARRRRAEHGAGYRCSPGFGTELQTVHSAAAVGSDPVKLGA